MCKFHRACICSKFLIIIWKSCTRMSATEPNGQSRLWQALHLFRFDTDLTVCKLIKYATSSITMLILLRTSSPTLQTNWENSLGSDLITSRMIETETRWACQVAQGALSLKNIWSNSWHFKFRRPQAHLTLPILDFRTSGQCCPSLWQIMWVASMENPWNSFLEPIQIASCFVTTMWS